jgi:tetratricopeptide (TPR) repeat protein
MQAKNELSVEGEEIWQDLKIQFEWADKFDLFVLFTNNPLISKLLRERIKLIYTGNQTPIHYFEPQAPETLIYDVFSFLNPLENEHLGDSERSPIWLELNKYGEQWEAEQKSLLARMNESRDRLRKHHPRPFVIVLNDDLSQLVRIISPDLWSVRAYSRILTQEFLVEVKEVGSGISQPIHTENLFNIHKERIDDIDQHPKIKEWQRLVDKEAQGIDVLYAGYDAFCVAFDNGFYEQAENVANIFLKKSYHLKAIQKDDQQVLRGLSVALECVGNINQYHGDFSTAKKNYSGSLALHRQRQRLSGDQPQILRDISISLEKIGVINQSMGNYTEALPLYERSLSIREKVLGPEHPGVATTLNNLAVLYQSMGNYTEALPLYERALSISEKVLGPEHPDVATTLNNLAMLYESMGNYTEALPLYERALSISEKVLGPEHPDVATTLNNWAVLYQSMGNYTEALPLYERALSIREKVLGPEHPDVAATLNNWAELYRLMGNYTEALPLYERALGIIEKVLGPEHPDVATTLNNLAGLYESMGNYTEALPLYERALSIREKVLGPEHPDVATTLNNLAVLYESMGNYTEALPLYERALGIIEKVLGPEHPNTKTTSKNMQFCVNKMKGE